MKNEEKKLQEEYERLKKNLKRALDESKETLEEAGYISPAVALGGGRSVNSLENQYAKTYGNSFPSIASLTPEEALEVAISRTLKSGSPINNIGFYDEVNWHLSNLNHASKNPLDIKNAIIKLINK